MLTLKLFRIAACLSVSMVGLSSSLVAAEAPLETPSDLKAKTGLKDFEYTEATGDLPNYQPSGVPRGPARLKIMQQPLSPEESLKHLVMRPGFEAKLFAAEPQITKPICMAWDERGRLWIAETVDYPNERQGPGQGHDRIKICEDTDGDGVADKFTIFADKLSIPTSLLFANGGVIVLQAPDTLFLKDTDGDDKADVRQVLFSGWGTGDTHAGPSNLHWGFDNWIWGTVGYSGFNGVVGGKTNRFAMGFFRFKPDGSVLEYVRSSNNNTWGLGLSEEGIVFGSTANNNASMYMPIPNRYYEAVNGWSASALESIADSQTFYPVTDKIRQVDWHGKYTAGAGHALYTARSFPKEYWNRIAFVAEPTGHLLGQFYMEPHGADFTARNRHSFLASDDEWTAPIMAEVGPDGALWMIDWYNYIVQHNPTPAGFKTGKGSAYETPLRDKSHGRIYRIVHHAAKRAPSIRLDKASPPQLVATLKNDNLFWRMHAQRLLVERGQKDVVPALLKLVSSTKVDAIGLNPAAIHALWTLHGLGALGSSQSAVVGALKNPSAGVRRAAVGVLPRTEASVNAILRGKTLEDSDAQVRLAALLALAEMPASQAAGAAIYAMLQQSQNSKDRWIAHAAISAAARNDTGFLEAVLANPPASQPIKIEAPVNLVRNPSIESERDGRPLDWAVRDYSGQAEHALAEIGHTGRRSLKIVSKGGADASWFTEVELRPNVDYRLSAWIKTEEVKNLGNAQGALLNVHELQSTKTGAVTGSEDWTRVETTFNSGERSAVTINCLLGGWGRSSGTAWYDDLELTAVSMAAFPGEVGQVVRVVTRHYAQRGPSDSIVQTLIALKGAAAEVAIPILDGLVAGWPKGKAPNLTARDQTGLASLIQSLPEGARERLVVLSQQWGRSDLFSGERAAIASTLREQVANPLLADEPRIAAAQRLIALDDQPATIQTVLQPITTLTAPALAIGLLNAVAESHGPGTGRALAERWPVFTPLSRRTGVATLLRRADWSTALLDAVDKGDITKTELAPAQWRQLSLSTDQTLAQRARKLVNGGKPPISSAEREEVVKKLLPLAREKGEIARGKEVFKANCLNCHAFEGEGANIGPDLTGIGARDRTDIFIDILDPNRSVEANYRLWNVTTKEGETFSGRLETETQTTVEILDLTSQKHIIQRKDIASMGASALSIMPVGFEALPAEDLKGLLDYLTKAPPPDRTPQK